MSGKPLRRTAWGLLIGGLVGTVLVFGGGTIVVVQGPRAGPDQTARWPAGETASLFIVPASGTPGDQPVNCSFTPERGQGEPAGRTEIGDPLPPVGADDVTVACDAPVALLTGTPRVIPDLTRGPLLAVPLFAILLGIAFFFPRFTGFWARGPLSRLLRVPPPG